MASTSYVGRTSAAAWSVMSKVVVEPPTKTSSLRSGFSRRAASVSNSKLCFGISGPQPFYEFSFSYLALAGAPIANRIDESQKLVENWIAQCGNRRSFVEWFERDATGIAVGPWPYWREFIASRDFNLERRGCVRSRHAAGDLAMVSRKGVLQSVDQELFQR